MPRMFHPQMPVAERLENRTLFAAGMADTTFMGGVVSIPISEKDKIKDDPQAVEIQPDGKIVVVGTAGLGGGGGNNSGKAVLVRCNEDGSPDATFGDHGIVRNPFEKLFPNSQSSGLSDVAIMADGRIVVSGFVSVGKPSSRGFNVDAVVARFTGLGVLDTTFGGGGVYTKGFESGGADQADVVSVQPDGSVLVAGLTGQKDGGRVFLLKLTADGTPDPEFGGRSAGAGPGTTLVRKLTDKKKTSDRATALQVAPNGKIVIAGVADSRGTSDLPKGRVFVARFTMTGTLDPTFFGPDARMPGTTVLASMSRKQLRDRPEALAFDPPDALDDDSPIVIAANSQSSRYDFDFVKVSVSADGRLVGDMVRHLSPGQASLSAMAFQGNGQVVASGSSKKKAGSNKRNFVLARFNMDGMLDLTFATNGLAITRASPTPDVADLALGGNKIVVVSAFKDVHQEFNVRRYENDVDR